MTILRRRVVFAAQNDTPASERSVGASGATAGLGGVAESAAGEGDEKSAGEVWGLTRASCVTHSTGGPTAMPALARRRRRAKQCMEVSGEPGRGRRLMRGAVRARTAVSEVHGRCKQASARGSSVEGAGRLAVQDGSVSAEHSWVMRGNLGIGTAWQGAPISVCRDREVRAGWSYRSSTDA